MNPRPARLAAARRSARRAAGEARSLLALGVTLALVSCAEERTGPARVPVYAEEVRPILEARCVSCHDGDAPPGGFAARSFLEAIACMGPGGAPVTLPADARAPLLAALDNETHRGLVDAPDRRVLEAWVRGGTPAFRGTVHDPGIVDPRAAAWHGAFLRERRWAPMLDAADVDACGRCHEGSPARPPGVVHPAPGATSCTSCHAEPEGVLACNTCHGSGTFQPSPERACFFPAALAQNGAHAAHATPSATHGGMPCETCHPLPGSNVMSGVHGNGGVEIIFDAARAGPGATYDRSSGVCAVACHDRGGARARPVWADAPPMRCGDCHGSPPAQHYRGPCTDCHVEADAEGTRLTASNLHFNGRVDLGRGDGSCGACHGTADDPWPTTHAHPPHARPNVTSPIACESCHVVPRTVDAPGHLDGNVTIAFSGRALDRGAAATWDGRTCSSVACHGANLVDPPPSRPDWQDTSGIASTCDACHKLPPTGHTASGSCDRAECHGSEVVRMGSVLTISPTGKTAHIDGVIVVPP